MENKSNLQLYYETFKESEVVPFSELDEDFKKSLSNTMGFAQFNFQIAAKPIVEKIASDMEKVMKSLYWISK